MAAQTPSTFRPQPPPEAPPHTSLEKETSQDLSLSACTKPDSESEYTQGVSEEEEEEEEEYTDSDFSTRKQKGASRAGPQVEPRVRVDTPMTRKLRPVRGAHRGETAPLGAEEAAAEKPEMAMDSKNDLPVNGGCEPLPEYSRGLSEEEACEQLVEIQGMWEMSSILDFLCVFKDVLKLDLDFTAESLEDAIVRSAGPGILAHIHMVLMLKLTPRSQITEHTWTGFLASKLYSQFIREGSSAFLNFFPRKGHESEDYASLPSSERVKALKSLCELCGDHEGIRNMFDSILKPKKAKGQKGKRTLRTKPVTYSLDDFRRVPYGEGINGEKFWYLDMWEQAGVRMYKELQHDFSLQGSRQGGTYESGKFRGWPKSMFVGRKKKGGKSTPKKLVFLEDVPCGKWTIVASNLEEFEELSSILGTSKKRKPMVLGKRIRGEIMAELEQRDMVQQKRQKAAEKLRVRLGDVIIDPEGRLGRSQRKRKEISYRFDAYDQLIEDGILASGIPEDQEGDEGCIRDESTEQNGLVQTSSPQRLLLPETKPQDSRACNNHSNEFPKDARMSDFQLSLKQTQEKFSSEQDMGMMGVDPIIERHIENSNDALHEMRNYPSNTPEGCHLSSGTWEQHCDQLLDIHRPDNKSKTSLLIKGERCAIDKTCWGPVEVHGKIDYTNDTCEDSVDALSSDGY